MPLAPLPDDWSRALCIVAHPDDLEYGAAAAVAKWTSAGRDVRYLLATRGEAGIDGMDPPEAAVVREAEEIAGAAEVGVTTVEFLEGHIDGIVEYGLPLRRDLAAAIRRHRPELVVSMNFRETWGGTTLNMADHRNVGLAALDAARDAGNRWIFPDEGVPWDGVRWVVFGGSPQPTHALDVTGHVDAGVASLRHHAAYLEGLGGEFDPDAFLRAQAEMGGAQFGCEHAVTFELFQI